MLSILSREFVDLLKSLNLTVRLVIYEVLVSLETLIVYSLLVRNVLFAVAASGLNNGKCSGEPLSVPAV